MAGPDQADQCHGRLYARRPRQAHRAQGTVTRLGNRVANVEAIARQDEDTRQADRRGADELSDRALAFGHRPPHFPLALIPATAPIWGSYSTGLGASPGEGYLGCARSGGRADRRPGPRPQPIPIPRCRRRRISARCRRSRNQAFARWHAGRGGRPDPGQGGGTARRPLGRRDQAAVDSQAAIGSMDTAGPAAVDSW